MNSENTTNNNPDENVNDDSIHIKHPSTPNVECILQHGRFLMGISKIGGWRGVCLACVCQGRILRNIWVSHK